MSLLDIDISSLGANGLWDSPLLASGFISAWMLWWTLAGLIPIALHFWFQRQRREMNWAAMHFLVSAIQKQSRRIRLQQLILLLLRVAILITLALAAAQPFLSSREPNWMGAVRTPLLWVGVLDTSYSMQYVDSTRQTRWEQGIAKARQMIEQLQPGDGIILLTLGAPPRVIFSEPTFDRTTALLELAKLTPSSANADLTSTAAVLEDLLKNARRSHPELDTHQVVLFTDTAGEAWNTAPASALESSLQNLTKDASLFVERVGDGKDANVAITDFRIDSSRPKQPNEVTLEAEVANFSTDSETEATVQLWLDNQTIQSETVSLTPRERKQVRFQQKFSEAKLYRLEARISADGLAIDDRRNLLLTRKGETKILLLEDLPGQAKYMEIALSNPGGARDKWSSFVDVLSSADWRDLDLQNVDLVVLCNVSLLPEQLTSLLRDYVQRGGKLLGFLGDRVDPSSYQILAKVESSPDSEQSFFPLPISVPSPLSVYGLDPRNYESSFLKVFQDFPESGLLTTPIFRFWKLELAEPLPESIHVDLATTENDPLLLSYRFGNGRIAWWLTSPTPLPATIGDPEPWNAMAAWPSFLPMIREQVNELTRSSDPHTQRLVGEPLQGYLPPGVTDEQVSVLRPDGRTDTLRPLPPRQDGFRAWVYDNNDIPGLYEVQVSQFAAPPASLFAVNVDTLESDLASEGTRRFQKWLLPEPSELRSDKVAAEELGDNGKKVLSDPSVGTHRAPIFHWLLGTLFGLLVTESLVAFWLGRSRA